MFANNKLKHFLMAILLVGGLSLTSCGGSDDEPDFPDGEEQVDDENGGGGANANPMVGKTIRCVDKYEDPYAYRINTNFSITFNSATRFTQVLKQTVEELDWATNKWTVTRILDNELTGTYSYSDSQIVLNATDGTVIRLIRNDQGWADGNYVYK